MFGLTLGRNKTYILASFSLVLVLPVYRKLLLQIIAILNRVDFLVTIAKDVVRICK